MIPTNKTIYLMEDKMNLTVLAHINMDKKLA